MDKRVGGHSIYHIPKEDYIADIREVGYISPSLVKRIFGYRHEICLKYYPDNFDNREEKWNLIPLTDDILKKPIRGINRNELGSILKNLNMTEEDAIDIFGDLWNNELIASRKRYKNKSWRGNEQG